MPSRKNNSEIDARSFNGIEISLDSEFDKDVLYTII